MPLPKRPRVASRSARSHASSSLCISLAVLAGVGATFAVTGAASGDGGRQANARAAATGCAAAALARPSHMRIVRKPGTKTIYGPAMTLPPVPASCGGKRTVRYGLEGTLPGESEGYTVLGRLYSITTNQRRELSDPDTVAFHCQNMRGVLARPFANITYRRNGKVLKEQYPKEGQGPPPKRMCKKSSGRSAVGLRRSTGTSAAKAGAGAKCATAPSHMRIFVKPGTKHIRGISMTLPSVPTSCHRSVRYGILGAMYDPDPDKLQVMGRSYSVKTDDRRKLSEPDTWAFACNSSNDDAIAKPYAAITYTKAGKRVTERFPPASSTKWPVRVCKS